MGRWQRIPGNVNFSSKVEKLLKYNSEPNEKTLYHLRFTFLGYF